MKQCPLPLIIKGTFQNCPESNCQGWNKEKEECLIISTLLSYRTLSNASIQMLNYAQRFSDMADKYEELIDEQNEEEK